MRSPSPSLLVLFALPLLAGCAARSQLAPAAAPGAPPPAGAPAEAPGEGGRLRIIAFGAHPDDCEIKAGGAGALWASQGHQVKFVSLTNGDIGHWQAAGGPLARRRLEEVEQAAKMLGVTTQVLDIHDGELMPSLENRRKVTRLIREWKADLVLAPRPNDYHPDHRYTGILVQDAAYMVTVPFFCPDTPHLQKNPTFLYYSDHFQRPNPFRADVVVDIDPVLEKKLNALGIMKSQFFEGGANGHPGLLASDEGGRAKRDREVSEGFARRFRQTAENYRSKLGEYYGDERAGKITTAEAFEVCEYGNQPSKEDLKKLFPFFKGN